MEEKTGYFYFVRHGESKWNVENKICGVTDIPLTEHGIEQAHALAEQIREEGLRIDQVLCSPLLRAKRTAEEICAVNGLPLREEERLKEQNFGRYESTPRNGAEFRTAKEHFIDSYDAVKRC
ncbi:MAG: histidine phosphatase family protein [Solobacterium sp.]|nr:histidine phosphatase family protein [Solobacterium sp.]